jgi:hypothetical protein
MLEAKKTIIAFDDLHEVPDPATQMQALKDIHKIAGDYPADQIDVNTGPDLRRILSEAKARRVQVDAADAIDITPAEE